LRLGEVETVGDVGAVGDAQVLLAAELALEVLQLGVCERRPSTAQLLRRRRHQLGVAAAAAADGFVCLV